MTHNLFIQINPDCSNFLAKIQDKKHLSIRQNSFIERIQILNCTIKQLNLLNSFKFTEEEQKAIERGSHYAISKSLEKKFTQQQAITLTDLRNTLNQEFHINNKTAIDFIIKSILDNDSIPFALSLLPFSFNINDYCCWSNHCTGTRFKHILKARLDSKNGNIIFRQKLMLRNSLSNLTQGFAQLQFSVNEEKNINLLPLTLKFNFVKKKELKKFKKELCQDFQDWIFQPRISWHILDIWVIPNLLGCLVGLVAMIGLIALGLTPISPLLLPPIGLALSLCLSSIMHHYVYSNIKKDHEKFQRPIYLFNRKPIYNTAFFNHSIAVKSSITAEAQFALNNYK